MLLQLNCIELGSVGLDMELDTFDPRPEPWPTTAAGRAYSWDSTSAPRELTDARRAVAKQVQFVAAVHERGGEVLASSP
jgi:hypothetical protein